MKSRNGSCAWNGVGRAHEGSVGRSTECMKGALRRAGFMKMSCESKSMSLFDSAYAASLKASALVTDMLLTLEPTPSLYGTPPPPYDNVIADMPPEYMGRDEFDHCRVGMPATAPRSGVRIEKVKTDGALLGDSVTPLPIDLNDTSKFRSHSRKKKGAKRGAQDQWTEPGNGGDKGNVAGGGEDGGNGDGSAGNGDAGGAGGDGAGGGGGGDDGAGGGGGDDEGWDDGGNKKKNKKKKKKKEEDEDEEKKHDGWGGFTTTTKKKKGKKNKASTTLAEEPPQSSFQDVNLNDGVPQLDLSFDTGDTNKTTGFSFGGWGNSWNTGAKGDLGLADNKAKDEKKDDGVDTLDAWAPVGKKGKKKNTTTNSFELGDLGDSNELDNGTGDANVDEKKKEENTWASFAVVGKKEKKPKKGADTIIEEAPSNPEPVSGPVPVDEWSGWSTSTKDDKKKKKKLKGTNPFDAIEETPKESEPVAEPAGGDDTWGTWGDKAKKSNAKTVGEPPTEPDQQPEPVDESTWASIPSKKEKKKKTKNITEELSKEEALAPAPDPIVPENDVDWATPAGKKGRKRKGKLDAEEPLAAPPATADPDPVDDRSSFTVTGKKKNGKKGAVAEAIEEDKPVEEPPPRPPEPEPQPDTADDWGAFASSTKTKKPRKGAVVEEAVPEPPRPSAEPVPEPVNIWEITATEKKKGKKGTAVEEPIADQAPEPEPQPETKPEAEPVEDWGFAAIATKKAAGVSEVRRTRKGNRALSLEESPREKETENITAVVEDDPLSWATTATATGKQGKKKGAAQVKTTEERPPVPAVPDAPESPADDSWGWGTSKNPKDKKGKKNKAVVLEPEPVPEPEPPKVDPEPLIEVDEVLTPKERRKKEREARKQAAAVAESNDNNAANTVSTDLVKSPALDDNSWWGAAADKKKGKKGKDANEPPPPAPTPPAQDLDSRTTTVDVEEIDTWGAFTGSGVKTSKTKKTSLSRTTSTTLKSSRIEDSKSTRAKSRGFEVVDVTDEFKEKEEPVEEVSAAKGVKSFWGGTFGVATTATFTKSKTSKAKEETSREAVETAPDKLVKEESKDSVKKKKTSAVDADMAELQAASATAADKATAPSAPTTRTTTTSMTGIKSTGKTSVAERIKLLEESKKREKEAAKEKEKLKAKEKASAHTVVPQQPASPPDVKLTVEPVANDPPPSKKSSKPKASTVPTKSTSKKNSATAAASATLLDESSTPRDSVPGSFPGAYEDELVDMVDLAPLPKSKPTQSQPAKAPKKSKKVSPVKQVAVDEMATPPVTAPADENKAAEASPDLATAKPAKKERPRVERTAGASSWGFWGASPKKPVKKESKPKDDADPSSSVKKPKEKSPPTLTRSKSMASEKKTPAATEKDVEKSSGSDEKRPSTGARVSRHSRGMSFSNFMMGGAPPVRTKSMKQNGTSASRHSSRRPSVDIDDSGILSPSGGHVEMPGKAAKLMGVNGTKTPRKDVNGKKRASRVPDPYAIDDDDDLVMVNGGDGPETISPGNSPIDSKPHRRKSKREPKPGNADDDIVMVEPGSSGRPDVVSGPEDLAFVIDPPKERANLKRSNTTTATPKKSEGLLGLFGSFRKPTTAPEHSRSRSYREEDLRKQTPIH
ncbi:conserved hypothetical protein [Histoplasma capsulatum H143]|uniref:Neurofilament heavy polypeptide n=1 Tax=Ajellomyces capsulatus (strain H143) TaxID=544712 RepID=C6H7J2_AJECH|nr:conserved hypothetical protein [Histoplasma capsulatum H143]